MKVTVPGYGEITVDISYGGALYAFVNAEIFGLDVNKSRTRDLVDAATAVTNAVKSQVQQKQQARSHKFTGCTERKWCFAFLYYDR